MSSRSPAAPVIETILTTVVGGALGGAVGLLGGVPVSIACGVSGGVNGALSGRRQAYDWRSAAGWLAFVADSTWGLAGTTLGSVLHLVNLAHPRPAYRVDRSRRRNRHVFDRGVTLRRGFAFTLGNVVSDASAGESAPALRQQLVDRHEGLHIWQSRGFGPLYQGIYLAWFVLGAAAGLFTWVVRRGRPGLFRLVETAAYYDNPFEFWAYKRDHHWEDNRADPVLKWRRPRWLKRKPADG